MEHALAWVCIGWRGATRALGAIAFVWASLLAFAIGCSSSAPTAKCGRSPACGPEAACVDDGSGSGPSCQKVCTRQTDCPFNAYCNDGQKSGRSSSWCVESTYPVPQVAGQWGASCSAGCDEADGFDCYAISPIDPNAFCTTPDCAQDSDCAGGWWCAAVNVAPNHTTTQRSFGPTRNWCLPRQYCATCQTDHDCSKAADGIQQHCVPDSAGNGFCSPQCGSNAACPLDATCQRLQWNVCAQADCQHDSDCQANGTTEQCFSGVCASACKKDADCPASNGTPQHCGPAGACVTQVCDSDDDCPTTATTFQHCNAGACTPECSTAADCNAAGDQTCIPSSVCVPRAGLCVGDHSFCAPCLSDADCTGGYCLDAQYSTERFCSHAMIGAALCSATVAPVASSCPAIPASASAKGFGCTTSAEGDFAPANQCVGEVAFGASQGQVAYVAGCWTLHP